jgi:hypothetical protein
MDHNIDAYVAKAKECEKKAADATDEEMRLAYLQLARGYLTLANYILTEAPLNRPL